MTHSMTTSTSLANPSMLVTTTLTCESTSIHTNHTQRACTPTTTTFTVTATTRTPLRERMRTIVTTNYISP
eukprot:m.28313 g.28313  ORF g.28313 m.28313 type:complete len:71 (+) comp15898_c0_seq1:1558-1770(+)